MHESYLLVLSLLTICLVGCFQKIERRLGIISEVDTVLLAPEVASVGVPFEVTVITYSGNCAPEPDLEVSYDEKLVLLQPYDTFVVGVVCPPVVHFTPRAAEITLDQFGDYLLRVEGASSHSEETIFVEQGVEVN